MFVWALSLTPHLDVTCGHLAMPIGWHTGDGDEQSGFTVMDVTERLSDRGAFLAETFIHVNIHPCTPLNTLYILIKAESIYE